MLGLSRLRDDRTGDFVHRHPISIKTDHRPGVELFPSIHQLLQRLHPTISKKRAVRQLLRVRAEPLPERFHRRSQVHGYTGILKSLNSSRNCRQSTSGRHDQVFARGFDLVDHLALKPPKVLFRMGLEYLRDVVEVRTIKHLSIGVVERETSGFCDPLGNHRLSTSARTHQDDRPSHENHQLIPVALPIFSPRSWEGESTSDKPRQPSRPSPYSRIHGRTECTESFRRLWNSLAASPLGQAGTCEQSAM